MKVSFINPSMTGRRRRGPMEPLAVSVLSGLTPREWETSFHDEAIEEIPFDDPTDLVAISAHTFTTRRAYQIARDYRSRGIPVVMGGYHPSLLKEEVQHFCDAVLVGEAEGAWRDILADAAAGTLKPLYEGGAPQSLQGIHYDRDIFRGKPYRHVRLVQFGRGCRFACDFCSVHQFFEGRSQQRPVEEVVEEIRALPRAHLFFVDDNLYVGAQKTREFLEALIPLKRRWTCQASIDIAEDQELLELLARAGCYSILIGFESTTQETLDKMKKRWNQGPSNYERVVERLHRHGILVYGTFVFGYDDEPSEAFQVCGDFVMRSKLFLAAFNLLQPTPNTPIFDRLRDEGRMKNVPWWLDPESRFCSPVFQPKGITVQELEERVHQLRSRFFSYRGIFSRAIRTGHLLRSPTKLGFYLFVNSRYRRELKRMQFQPFGDPEDLSLIPVPAAGR